MGKTGLIKNVFYYIQKENKSAACFLNIRTDTLMPSLDQFVHYIMSKLSADTCYKKISCCFLH